MPSMSDRTELLNRLRDVLTVLQRIPDRFESIHEPNDFISDKEGLEHLDSICMVLIIAGEAIKQIDFKTDGLWRARFPQIPWAELIGIRNIIAHGYFDVSHEQVFGICKNDIPALIESLKFMISDLESD